MKDAVKVIVIGILAFLVTSCEYIRRKDQVPIEVENTNPVARVGDSYLYNKDLEGLVPKGLRGKDSAEIVEKYVDSWIRKQLMINQASANIEFDEVDIERRVLDYRYALMVHEYEKLYVNQKLDAEVDEEEIARYYQEKSENFVLQQPIIRGLYVKLPNDAPRIEVIRRNVRNYPNSDLDEIKTYCYQFASTYLLEDSVWITFDEVIRNTPMQTIPDRTNFLASNQFIETADENDAHLLRILDHKLSGEAAPVSFVNEDIKNIILNRRKIELTKALEEEIYKEAQRNNDFEKYQIN